MEPNNNILVFDTETSGLFPQDTSNLKTLDLPTIVQLSYVIYDINKHAVIDTYNVYVKQPKETDYSKEAFKINRITKDMCDNGVSIMEALYKFCDAYMSCKYIVAHNLAFDKKMIQLEVIRNLDKMKLDLISPINLFNDTFNALWGIKLYCSMEKGKHITNVFLKGKYGNYKKSPKLQELHEKLFGTIPNNLHDSLVDCKVCLKCYVKMTYDKTLEIY